MHSHSKPWLFFCVVLISLVITPVAADARFSMSSDMELSAYGGPTYDVFAVESTEAVHANDVTVNGSTGAYASGKFSVDRSMGTIKTYAYATTGTNMSAANNARADVQASMSEMLTFYIPTGTYDDNLYVSIQGSIEGSLNLQSASGDPTPTVGQSWDFGAAGALGGDTYSSGGPMYNTLGDFSQNFTLNVLLATAGTYSVEKAANIQLTSSLISRAWVENGVNGPSWAETDFYNTARFDAIIAPQGVDWVSESGLFLTAEPPGNNGGESIPEPTTFLLFGLGLATLAVIRRWKR